MTSFMKSEEVKTKYKKISWESVVFSEFESALTSETRPFPCVFGVTGFKANRLRFAFPDPLTPETLAPILRSYLTQARSIGPMTSLVVFSSPDTVKSIEYYRSKFWDLLDGLARIDDDEHPQDIPDDLDHPAWEFCFSGEPIFVVCNSPAHVLRQSRRSTGFMITFQPRWVFEGITDSNSPAILNSLSKLRNLLHNYDVISPSPTLGKYGEPENREYTQYFIDDTNTVPSCPFHKIGH